MFSMLLKLNFGDGSLDIGKGISIDMRDIENIVNKGIRIVVIIILMHITIKIGNRLINKFVKRQIESNARFSMDNQKAKTIGEVLKSVLKYMTYFIGAALILSDAFNGISVAMASVGGFALGFGAQSLVKDIINGFFILFEDQYGVGDHVTIGTFSGIVETIGIRTTVIRDFSGDVHLIPNGTINQVTNHSRGNIRFIVDVDISYEEDIDNAINVISNVCNKYKDENENIVEPIEVLGVNSLNASSVTIRIIGKAKPLKQWEAERELRKRVKKVLDEEGIEIPYPKTQLINKEGDK
ncbi:mechanosensitive ion channel family protein [Clostridium paraputrificum]|uniref:mechanosensitive ion channel family protein n=1 Tax=Clostridium paraputrificum TaxID=29363 RepID=UPI00247FBFF7|nr:mechanosensitive ion channel family protein [Clostridium paraputrificum]MDB2086543.1 mechanosensitive ion channel family protein [Clostridium paraputrificum]